MNESDFLKVVLPFKGKVFRLAKRLLVSQDEALAIFAYNDSINWKYGLILSLGNAAGGWFMSRWSVDKGDKFVKKVLIIMVLAMAIKLWFPDFYSILASEILDLF